jgi:hypothetical protein
MMLRAALLLAGLIALPVTMAQAAPNPVKQCASFPTMKKMKLQSVASEMDFNGIPMVLRRFDSEEDMEAVFAFYRKEWAGVGQGGKPPVEYPLGEWKVIATLREPCFYTVQVKASGRGSEGLLGLSAPPPERTQVKEDVPMLPGTRVVNDIAHNDAGKTARTLLLKNAFSADANADFYRRNLGDQGWQVLSRHQGAVRDTRADNMVLKQGPREVSVTISQTGRESSVLINYVDQP